MVQIKNYDSLHYKVCSSDCLSLKPKYFPQHCYSACYFLSVIKFHAYKTSKIIRLVPILCLYCTTVSHCFIRA